MLKLSNFFKSRSWIILAFAVLLSGCQSIDIEQLVPLSEKYSAVVINARSGEIVYSRNGDAIRYPASLTKMMTLYMLFERLKGGTISKQTKIKLSSKARAAPPTKLWFKSGDTISVELAIRALAVKSANDVAIAVGEFLAGSESAFARSMTTKARILGLKSTQFRNASGLPDKNQYTTARDMAKLGILLRKQFPRLFHYFSHRSFEFRGRTIKGHNHLLADRGVDGIKTGYIRASGFNIVVSVKRNGKRFIVVVMGGNSGKERDRRVRELIAAHAR